MIRFACPGCSAAYSVPDEKAGKTGKCPKCQAQFLIPTPEPGPAAPPPPPAPAAVEEVEIAPCPRCQARLMVAVTDLGADVECPHCHTAYTAARPGPARASVARAKAPVAVPEERPSRRSRRDEDEDDDRPARRSRRDDDEYEDDEEDDRPSSRKKERSRSKATKSRRKSGLDPFWIRMLVLSSLIGFVLLLTVFYSVFSLINLLGGVVVANVGWIWFLVVAFKDETVEGLLCMFLPLYAIFYAVKNFDGVKRPLALYFLGLFQVVLAFACMAVFGFRA